MTSYQSVTQLVAEASTLFVTPEEVQRNLRITNNAEWTVIIEKVKAATRYVEERAGKKISGDQFSLIKPSINASENVTFSHTPVYSIDSITYYDTDNEQQTYNIANLYFFQTEDCAYLEPLAGNSWPEVYDRPDAITITYTTGYPSTIPPPHNLKQAIILLASHWMENRTAAGMHMQEIPHGVDELINLSKRGWF